MYHSSVKDYRWLKKHTTKKIVKTNGIIIKYFYIDFQKIKGASISPHNTIIY